MTHYLFLLLVFYSLISSEAITHAESSSQMIKPVPIESEQSAPPENDGMVFVKGRCFDMGDTTGDGDPDEKPVHNVCVDDFYIGRYEVTQREWMKVMGNNPSSFVNCDDCPVENISYLNVQEFIRRLNRKSTLQYRLPTETEWEYAARSGGKSEKWAGTNSENELEDYVWYKNNSGGKTHPVGQKKSNGLGLYDMSGNVQEWVSDWYEPAYYKTSPRKNPLGPPPSQYRAVRGGAWLNKAWGIRSSIRYRFTQDDRGREFGFRLAASPK